MAVLYSKKNIALFMLLFLSFPAYAQPSITWSYCLKDSPFNLEINKNASFSISAIPTQINGVSITWERCSPACTKKNLIPGKGITGSLSGDVYTFKNEGKLVSSVTFQNDSNDVWEIENLRCEK